MGCNTSQEATKDEKSAESNESQKEQSPSKTQEIPAPPEKSEEHHAATKIQAVFRGHQTRKSIIMKPAQTGAAQAQSKVEPEPTKAELEAEFRADDKDLCNAATMIQASFRGHQSRKQAEQVKQPEPAKRPAYGGNYMKGMAIEDYLGNPDQTPEIYAEYLRGMAMQDFLGDPDLDYIPMKYGHSVRKPFVEPKPEMFNRIHRRNIDDQEQLYDGVSYSSATPEVYAEYLRGMAMRDFLGDPDLDYIPMKYGYLVWKPFVQLKPAMFNRIHRRNVDDQEQLYDGVSYSAADEEELDIDLTDPELNKAATKIQASFRGHKVRKDTDN